MVGEANCVLCLDGLRGNGHYTRNRSVGVDEIYKPVNRLEVVSSMMKCVN